MKIGGRNMATLLGAPFNGANWTALFGMMRAYENFPNAFARYVFGSGNYPTVVTVKTPIGPLALNLYSRHDILTVNEIFCRDDYPVDGSLRTVVDFGSNIGISAAFFLSRNTEAFVHCYEPMAQNVERLHVNLRPFLGRYALHQQAVGTFNGPVEFAHEPTGRYGGIASVHPELHERVSVDCRDVDDILDEVLAERGEIDLLKVDVENTEVELMNHLRPDLVARCRAIYVEGQDWNTPLPGFSFRKQGLVAQMRRIG